jgi:hypothetical protein
MIFPLSWVGDIRVPRESGRTWDVAAAVLAIERAISAQKPKSVARVGSSVEFRAGIFRLVSNTNVLVPISSGHVDVQAEPSGLRIRYTIRFAEVLAFSLIVTAAVAVQVSVYPENTTRAFRAIVCCLPLIWLLGGNVAITLFRFPRLLKRAVQSPGAVS